MVEILLALQGHGSIPSTQEEKKVVGAFSTSMAFQLLHIYQSLAVSWLMPYILVIQSSTLLWF